MADAASRAAWAAMRSRVPALAAALVLPVTECAGGGAALEAQARLERAGVTVDVQGGVRFAPPTAAEYAAGPWVADDAVGELGALRLLPEPTPPAAAPGAAPARMPRRFASRIFRHLDALVAPRLWRRLSAERREGLLSAGGAGAGALWGMMPVAACDWFPSFFRAASLRRLGAMSALRGATCRIPCRGGGGTEVCGQLLDATLRHPLLCKQGPARMRPHRALVAALARLLRWCHAEVDIERVVPRTRACGHGQSHPGGDHGHRGDISWQRAAAVHRCVYPVPTRLSLGACGIKPWAGGGSCSGGKVPSLRDCRAACDLRDVWARWS